jgi:hypothetical protein
LNIENDLLFNKLIDLNEKAGAFEIMEKSIVEKTGGYDFHIFAYIQSIDLIITRLQGEQIADSLIYASPNDFIKSNLPLGLLFVVDGLPLESIDYLDPGKIKSIQRINSRVAYKSLW